MSLIPLRLLRAIMSAPLQTIGRSHWEPFITPTEWRLLTKIPDIMMPDLVMKPIAECNEGVQIDKDGFKVTMNLENYKPNEITVKTINNMVVIEGKNERQDDHGSSSMAFVRKYSLPNGYDPMKITSTFTSDGILNVKAPAPEEKLEEKEEHVIKIEHI